MIEAQKKNLVQNAAIFTSERGLLTELPSALACHNSAIYYFVPPLDRNARKRKRDDFHSFAS